MIDAFRSISYNLRKGGIITVLRKSWWRFTQLFYHNEEILIYITDRKNYKKSDTLDFFNIYELNSSDLKACSYEKMIYYPESIIKRYENGEKCFGLKENGKIISFAWVIDGYLHYTSNITRLFVGNNVAIYDCMTLPDYRGRGAYKKVLRFLLNEYIVLEKKDNVFIAVDPNNQPSIKGIEGVGFKLYAMVKFTKKMLRKKLDMTFLTKNGKPI